VTTTIRPVALRDADALRAIYNDAVATTTATMDTEPRSPEQQAVWMDAHDGDPYPAFVAEDAAGHVLGYASLSPYNPKSGYNTTAEVSVYVHRDWRGHGIGGQLLAELVADAERRGFRALVALITSGNEASRRLHRRHGFATVGTLNHVARKFDRWVDVTILQKSLGGEDDENETPDADGEEFSSATS
jgi:phosphinothricin acetyltransferase